MWRADGTRAPTGIVGDTGSHVFSFMEFFVGGVKRLVADNIIVAPRRPLVEGGTAQWRALHPGPGPDGGQPLRPCRHRRPGRDPCGGGPGELYRDSVYPNGCFGTLGLALEAGLRPRAT